LTPGAAGAFASSIELISKADPAPDGFGGSSVLDMSADGRYVLFQSDAPNLVPGQVDGNNLPDLFLRDRTAGTTTLITHQAGKPSVAGHPGPRSFSFFVSSLNGGISADGRYVVFTSVLKDLLPGPATDGSPNVFLYDRVNSTTTLISHAAGDPTAVADGSAGGVLISADGDDILFSQSGGNLVAGQTPSAAGTHVNAFLYHRPSGSLTLISHPSGAPTMGANGDSLGAAISADGGYLVFASGATDLIPGLAGSPASSVYLYQRATGAVTLVSHAAGSSLVPGDGDSYLPQISADGRWLAFLSRATNLIAGQVPSPVASPTDAFLYDRISGSLRLVSHTIASPQTPGNVGSFTLSADGRYVAFDSPAPDLVPGQVNGAAGSNVFVYDRIANATSLVSHGQGSATTASSPPGSMDPRLSADGRYIAYTSSGADLVPHQTDTQNGSDVFVYDQVARTTVLASHNRASLTTTAHGYSQSARISGDGRVVAFSSNATDLAGGQLDFNGFQDLFLFERGSAEVTALSEAAPDVPAVTPNDPSWAEAVSADGRYVVFSSWGLGLIPGEIKTSGTTGVYLRDRATRKTTLLSRSAASPPTATNGFGPALSADGNFAAFTVTDEDSNGQLSSRLLLYDRAADALILADHLPGSPGQPGGGQPVGRPAFSADGRYLAYTCFDCPLVPGQQDGGPSSRQTGNVFLYDRVTGTNTLVSHASGLPATTGDGDSEEPRISADGRFVAFLSAATDLAAGQTGATDSNVFVFDRTTGTVTLVSHTAGSSTAASGQSYDDPTISADGRWIAYRSFATDLVPGQIDTNGVSDIFLYDRVTGGTALVSHASSSPVTAGSTTQNDNQSEVFVALSADGRWVVFTSTATDLVPGVNSDQTLSVYLYDRTSGKVTLVSFFSSSIAGAVGAWQPGISADGSRITFLSDLLGLPPGPIAPTAILPLNLLVQDRITGSRTLAGAMKVNSQVDVILSLVPQLSADGRVIAFTSDAPLVAGDFNRNFDAFVYNATAQTGPVTVPPCVLFNGALRSNVRKPLTAAGACGVPATAKQVAIRLTVSKGTGQGNVQLFAGSATTAAAGILRFSRGATRGAPFNVSLGNGVFSLLPFVAGKGTVRVSVEIDGYQP
jgi:Tol biopolymer transport system component